MFLNFGLRNHPDWQMFFPDLVRAAAGVFKNVLGAMNYNLLTYAIYLTLMVFIIGYVGMLFYRNGRIFILSLFRNNAEQADYINKFLLTAYYLFNTGYAFVRLQYWGAVTNLQTLTASMGETVGLLILILAVTHYFNMGLIYFLSKKSNIFFHK